MTAPVLIVTGASSGIGAAAARLFASHGYRVVLAARRLERLQSLAQEIRAAGGQALAVDVDVRRYDQIEAMTQRTLDAYGQIDLLFNNAGLGRLDWLENLDPQAEIELQLEANLLGLIWTTRAVLPHMIARRQGHIINMSSVAGLLATPTYSVYAASKFGVRGFSEALRREVGVFGIHVSGIYPGGVVTEFTEKAGIHRKTGVSTPPWLVLSAEDVAQSVWWLAHHPRRTLVVPWPLRLAVAANRWLPGLVDWVIERRFVAKERVIK